MKNFLKDTSGNIAISVALLGIPLMLSAGAAIDYSQFARKQSSLQNVTDAAALTVAHDLQTHSQSEVEASVDDYLKSNLTEEQYNEIQSVTVVIDATKERVTVQVEGKHPTSLMRIAGIKYLNYTPESVVDVPTGNAEVILALDTTGSMSLDGKMDALKVSASTFVEDVLAANDTRERAKIGIVPFARYVNIGIDNRNASWMDVPDDYSETVTVQIQNIISSSGCTEQQIPDSEGILITRNVCDTIEYGEPTEEERNVDYTWRGCAGSRNYPLNLKDEDYSKKVPGLLNTYCPSRITQLTNDEAVLKDEINALVAAGSTYIPTGLIWAHRALSSGDPFNDGVTAAQAQSNNVQKAIVLMSDGENQSSVNATDKAWHNGTNLAQANQYTREVCDNIKGAGIQIYTIGFGNAIPQATLDLLKECSTNGSNYYAAVDGAALSAAFSSITSDLAAFQLSK